MSSILAPTTSPRPGAPRVSGVSGAPGERPSASLSAPTQSSGESLSLPGREGAQGASPWYIADNAVEKFQRRFQSQQWLPKGEDGYPLRAGKCSWAIGALVSVRADAKKAHYAGVETCASVWACPVCAASIRQARAAEIARAVEAHQAAGKTLAFMTLTLPHYRKDALADTLDTLLESWREMVALTAWKKPKPGVRSQAGIKARYGVSGVIRATEITYGANGWHPHLHTLIFLERELSDSALQALGDEVYELWRRRVEKRTGRTPSRAHGLDIRPVDTGGRVLSQYLAKISTNPNTKTSTWGVNSEMARGDVKKGRDSISPFSLLDSGHDVLFPDRTRKRLWREYYLATYRRRFMSWSRGLKATYGIEDKDDDALIADEIQQAEPVYLMASKVYRKLTPEQRAWVLKFAVLEDFEMLGWFAPGERLTVEQEADPPPAPDPV